MIEFRPMRDALLRALEERSAAELEALAAAIDRTKQSTAAAMIVRAMAARKRATPPH
jgi:hypothetical protein